MGTNTSAQQTIESSAPMQLSASAEPSAPMQLSASAEPSAPVQLSASAEQPAFAFSSAHSPLAMVSLLAPAAVENAARTPLEIVAVVDRSGSMSGSKIATMKETLHFLVTKGLVVGDAFSLVTFDNEVDIRLPLTVLDDSSGRKKACEVIAALNTGGTTNLSGGLLQGIDVLQRGLEGSGVVAAARTRAVLLFTDGIANCGIRDGPGILAAAQGAMGGAPLTIFTFGFGSDHQEETLRTLADCTNGLYYYIAKSEDIPQAFVDCLGGLVSVVAQNSTLTLEAAEGLATLGALHCSYKHTVLEPERRVSVSLGDLYSEDEKDVLLQLTLPAHPTSALGVGSTPPPTLCATLRYFDVGASRMAEVRTLLTIDRPTQPPAEQPVNIKLDAQRNRVVVAQAMERASKMADKGDLGEGLALLRQATEQAKQTPSAKTPLVQQLCCDLERVADGYSSRERYRASGSKMAKMSMMCHMQQRSNYTPESAVMYEKASKTAFKAKMMSGYRGEEE